VTATRLSSSNSVPTTDQTAAESRRTRPAGGDPLHHAARGAAQLGRWTGIGLGDFSGIVRYQTQFAVGAMNGTKVFLRIGHVEASARVLVNGTEAGTLLT